MYFNIYLRKKTNSQILFIPIFYKPTTEFLNPKKGFNCETFYSNALKKLLEKRNNYMAPGEGENSVFGITQL